MNYELIKERLKDISFEFKGRGFQEECDFVLKELVSVVSMKIYQQQITNWKNEGVLRDNPKKWCTNKQCYCTGDCQRMIKTPVELDNLDLLFNITERSERFQRNSISKELNNVHTQG